MVSTQKRKTEKEKKKISNSDLPEIMITHVPFRWVNIIETQNITYISLFTIQSLLLMKKKKKSTPDVTYVAYVSGNILQCCTPFVINKMYCLQFDYKK